MKRLAVFASGNGSNFEAIVQGCVSGGLDAQVALLVCDKQSAYVVERAGNYGIETFIFDPKEYAAKSDFEMQICELLNEREIDLVCLAGYMRIVGKTLLSEYGGKIINIHPSILPDFKGTHAIERSFESGKGVYGVTTHYVDDTLDGGEIIVQEIVVYNGGRVEKLEELIHSVEHKVYVETIKKIIER